MIVYHIYLQTVNTLHFTYDYNFGL